MTHEPDKFWTDPAQRLQYRVTTKIVDDNKVLVQELEDAGRVLARWILDTREQAVKDALIRMGWSPPEKYNYNDEDLL